MSILTGELSGQVIGSGLIVLPDLRVGNASPDSAPGNVSLLGTLR